MNLTWLLTSLLTEELKELCKKQNHYKRFHKDFDFLPKTNKKHDPAVFYKLPFLIARFKITEDSYETVVTNLDAAGFPQKELK